MNCRSHATRILARGAVRARAGVAVIVTLLGPSALAAQSTAWTISVPRGDSVQCRVHHADSVVKAGYPRGSLGFTFEIGIQDLEHPHRIADMTFDSAGSPLGLLLRGVRMDDGTGRTQVDAITLTFRDAGGFGSVTTSSSRSQDDTSRTETRDVTAREAALARRLAEWLWPRRCPQR